MIVGDGTAGCVIANRLIELANDSVLLTEAVGNPAFESLIAFDIAFAINISILLKYSKLMYKILQIYSLLILLF